MAEKYLLPDEIDEKNVINGKTEAQWQAELVAMASEICKQARARSKYEKCRALFGYINTKYGGGGFAYRTMDSPEPQRAVQTFAKKSGDCDDLVHLYNAMAEAVGIKSLIGVQQREEDGAEILHGVAAVILEGREDFEPSIAFGKDKAYRKYALSKFGQTDSENLCLVFIDLANGTFGRQGNFELFLRATPAQYANRAAAAANAKDWHGALSDYGIALAQAKDSQIYGDLGKKILSGIRICKNRIGDEDKMEKRYAQVH
jgi:hypothetical protein